MSNVLNFRLTVEDLLGPRVAEAIRRVQELGRRVETPHRLNVDTSQANGALSGVMGLVGKLGLAAAFATGAKAIVGMGAQMETTRVQFETFTGSAEKGNKVIADLQKFANLTPFDDEQVISAGRQLLAFGEDARSLNPILTKLGNISSATGKDFGELVSIYGKNKLSGIIQGEDLNQLNDSGIPVMKSLAAQLGVTTDKVKEMGAKGKITFSMLDKSFEELGGAGGKWGDLMDKQSQTVAGKWSSLVGFAQNMGGKIGEGINPLIGRLLDGGSAVLNWVSTHLNGIQKMFEPLQEAMQPLVDTFQKLWAEQYGNAEVGDVLATVFNRIGTVIKLVAPFVRIAATLLSKVWEQGQRVVNVLTKFWETSPRLQKFFAGLYEGALGTFKAIAEAASKFLGGIGGIIEGVFTGDFGKIKQGLKDTFTALADTNPVRLGMKSAQGFVEGYKKGLPKTTDLFTKGPGAAISADAATTFTQGGARKSAAMTAAASQGATAAGGVSGAGGKGVTNIYLTVGDPFKNATITAGTPQEAAKQTAAEFHNWFMAELNDVNTLASTN